MYLCSAPYYRVIVLMICLTLILTSTSYTQPNLPASDFKQQLSGLGKNVEKRLLIPTVVPCVLTNEASINNLCKQAILYDKSGNRRCCLQIIESIHNKLTALSPLESCQYNLTCAEYYTLHQRYDSAEAYSARANRQASEHKWPNEKARALLLLSAGAYKQRNISTAYTWADSALIITRKINNVNLEAEVLMQLALCIRRHFTAAGKRSFPYFITARDKAIIAGDSTTISAADLYLGVDYFELHKWAEGMRYFNEGIDLALTTTNTYHAYLVYTALSYSFEIMELPKKALQVSIQSLNLAQRQQTPYNLQHSYQEVAMNYQALHQYDSAILYANRSGQVKGVDPFWANTWDLKATIYNDMHNYQLAADMFKKSVDWYREDFLYRNQDQLSGYEAKLNTKEKELQVTEQKKRAIQLEWMIGGVGGLLCISAFAFVSQRKARRTLLMQNKVIEKQRSELENSLSEKEILLKEIHHRVKNNLSVISSLLELQSSGINDEAAKAAIAVGQNRVSSIALIHQQLYQHENLAAIELKGFLQDLIRQVSSIFKKPGTQLQIDIDVPETLLDIDTAVPLGLILNELLTNSFKYAFNNNKVGTISIALQQSPVEYILSYADNGPGINDEANIKNATTLGLRLINRLSKQVGGNATYNYENGSTFRICFKDSNKRKQES